MANSEQHDKDIKKLGELIKDIKIAMFTTAEPDGEIRSRPMHTQSVEFDGDIYFFTHASDPKVAEVRQDRHVNLSYAAPDKDRYVSVSGRASLLRDPAKNKELWNPAYKAWFPDGLEDPDLALLKVSVEKAEYWDTPSGAVVHLVGFIKALATHQPYQPGDNEKLDLAASKA